MKKKILLSFLLLYSLLGFTQHVSLHYTGSVPELTLAVAKANKLLSEAEFYKVIDENDKFDNTTYNGKQISAEMDKITTIEVVEYYKRRSKTNAKTQRKISMNTANLDRSISSIVNTLIHETIHAVDWLTDKKWDYTHRTQYEENPPISAPYVIGNIAERMMFSL